MPDTLCRGVCRGPLSVQNSSRVRRFGWQSKQGLFYPLVHRAVGKFHSSKFRDPMIVERCCLVAHSGKKATASGSNAVYRLSIDRWVVVWRNNGQVFSKRFHCGIAIGGYWGRTEESGHRTATLALRCSNWLNLCNVLYE